MQITQLTLLAFVASVSASANPFYNVPVCAQNCAKSLPTNCGGSPKCICNDQSFMWNVECCVANNCGAADQVATFQFANQLCSYVNVKITSPPQCAAIKSTQVASTLKTSATATSKTSTAATGNPTAVSGYVAKGCYGEATAGSGTRALNSTNYIDPAGMTVESCVAFCKGKGLGIAGLEYSQECWCGNAIQNGGAKLSDNSGCNLPCKGNSNEVCGGLAKLNVYQK